jgi:hypothetical protein
MYTNLKLWLKMGLISFKKMQNIQITLLGVRVMIYEKNGCLFYKLSNFIIVNSISDKVCSRTIIRINNYYRVKKSSLLKKVKKKNYKKEHIIRISIK